MQGVVLILGEWKLFMEGLLTGGLSLALSYVTDDARAVARVQTGMIMQGLAHGPERQLKLSTRDHRVQGCLHFIEVFVEARYNNHPAVEHA